MLQLCAPFVSAVVIFLVFLLIAGIFALFGEIFSWAFEYHYQNWLVNISEWFDLTRSTRGNIVVAVIIWIIFTALVEVSIADDKTLD